MKIPSYTDIMGCPIVRLVFDDHCMGMTTELECEVYGRLVYEDDKRYVIAGWVPKEEDPEVIETNWETYVILKKVVKRLYILSQKRGKIK